jgi:hypothetical protein
MPMKPPRVENPTLENLFAEFGETLRTTGKADFRLLDGCPLAERQELLSLMNVAVLTSRAFARGRPQQHDEQLEVETAMAAR